MPDRTAICPECHAPAEKFYRTVCGSCYHRHWRDGTLDRVPFKPKPVYTPPSEKVCAICKQVLPLDAFAQNN